MKIPLWPLALALAARPCFADDARYRADPKLALVAGAQSRIPAGSAAAILKEAGTTGKDGLADAARIHLWLEDNFKSAAAGGGFVGKTTAKSLLASRVLTGCHD